MSLLGNGADEHRVDPRRNVLRSSSFNNPSSPASIGDPLLGSVSGYGLGAAFGVFGWDSYNNGPRDSGRDRHPVTRDPGKSLGLTQRNPSQFAPREKEGTTKKPRPLSKQEVSKAETAQADESSNGTLLTRYHYDLLRQHRSNLISEVQETEMMLSVYHQQQHQCESQHLSSKNDQEPSGGVHATSDGMKRSASETRGNDGKSTKKPCMEKRKYDTQGASSDPTPFSR